MSKTGRIRNALPATVCELAALEQTTVRDVNAILCNLRQQGLARITNRHGVRYSKFGPAPKIWERA